MKTTISSKGQIVLPAEFRQMDRIEPGQEFDVKRLDRGDYRLVRRVATTPDEGHHRAGYSPARTKFFSFPSRSGVYRYPVNYLVDANVLSEPNETIAGSAGCGLASRT